MNEQKKYFVNRDDVIVKLAEQREHANNWGKSFVETITLFTEQEEWIDYNLFRTLMNLCMSDKMHGRANKGLNHVLQWASETKQSDEDGINILQSGGSKGADALFHEMAVAADHQSLHWSFDQHRLEVPEENGVRLTEVRLLEADEHLVKANEYLQRRFPTQSHYTNSLLRRNYHQIKATERVYAVCKMEEFTMKPIGGTSWAIVMAINLQVPELYVYDTNSSIWYMFNRKYPDNIFIQPEEWIEVELDEVPVPHGIYTGIGASELGDNGIAAIRGLYER